MTIDKHSLRPIGKWIAVTTDIGGQKETEAGIIYEDNMTGKNGMVWSTVAAVGDKVVEDIRPGDKIMWDISTNRGNHYNVYDLVHEQFVELVDRPDETD